MTNLIVDKQGKAINKSLINAELSLENVLGNSLYYNEVTREIYTKEVYLEQNHYVIPAGAWDEHNEGPLRSEIERIHFNLKYIPPKELLRDALLSLAKRNAINPLKERIERVKWDGNKRAERYFIDYLGAEDNEYTRAVTRLFFTGMVSRVYEPGCKFDYVLVLEGKQGIGKSTAVGRLTPDDYFNDNLSTLGESKDDYLALTHSWIVEISELSAMNKTSIEKMKNFISATSDLYRAPYEKSSHQHPRHCVFIGTTNNTTYLKDLTGSRRFLPVKCGVTEAKKSIFNVDENTISQILAEAKTFYDNHEPLVLSKEIESMAEEYREGAEVDNPVAETIKDYISMRVPQDWEKWRYDSKRAYFDFMSEGSPKTDEQIEAWLNKNPNGRYAGDNLKNYWDLKELTRIHQEEIEVCAFKIKTNNADYVKRRSTIRPQIEAVFNKLGWEKKQVKINRVNKQGYVKKVVR